MEFHVITPRGGAQLVMRVVDGKIEIAEPPATPPVEQVNFLANDLPNRSATP